MGLSIDKQTFEPGDYVRFRERLDQSLEALSALLERPGFGAGPTSMGAEVEMSLVDAAGRPLLANQEVLSELDDAKFTVELNRFNLEYNSSPSLLQGAPFAHLKGEFSGALARVREIARRRQGEVVLVGILPTLRADDFSPRVMTDIPRYHALARALAGLRKGPFHIHIDGDEPLDLEHGDVTLEGANTSLQVHLRVAPDQFSALYNAVQIATAPALAASTNSPLFLGHRLWHETRVALFKQSVDARHTGLHERDPRVSFGRRWIVGGIVDMLTETVQRHEPILPVLSDEDPSEVMAAGGVPELLELRLHNGTVWRWNRPVYDAAEGGHLRVEMRALPAGPTVADMLANTAFIVGLSLALAQETPRVASFSSFEVAHANFYEAARFGLDAELRWWAGTQARRRRAQELVPELVELARDGLVRAGVAPADFEPHLSLMADRVRSGQTGAVWQRRKFAELRTRHEPREAVRAMLEEYLTHCEKDVPVHLWPA